MIIKYSIGCRLETNIRTATTAQKLRRIISTNVVIKKGYLIKKEKRREAAKDEKKCIDVFIMSIFFIFTYNKPLKTVIFTDAIRVLSPSFHHYLLVLVCWCWICCFLASRCCVLCGNTTFTHSFTKKKCEKFPFIFATGEDDDEKEGLIYRYRFITARKKTNTTLVHITHQRKILKIYEFTTTRIFTMWAFDVFEILKNFA